jgi:hypothetical protein
MTGVFAHKRVDQANCQKLQENILIAMALLLPHGMAATRRLLFALHRVPVQKATIICHWKKDLRTVLGQHCVQPPSRKGRSWLLLGSSSSSHAAHS